MIDLKRFPTYYELEAEYLDIPKTEVIINKAGKALECNTCDNSFVCDHVRFIWNLPEEANYLESLGFLNVKIILDQGFCVKVN